MERGIASRPVFARGFESWRPAVAKREYERVMADLGRYDRNGATETVAGFQEIDQESPYYSPRVKVLADGIAVLWFTEADVGTRAHRLIFSDAGEVSYYRASFNTDAPQTVHMNEVELSGLEQIITDNDGVIGLAWVPTPERLAGEKAANG